MHVIDLLAEPAALLAWQEVPSRVVGLLKEARPVAQAIRAKCKNLPHDPGYGIVHWHAKDRKAWVVLGDGDDQATHNRWANTLKGLGIKDVRTEAESNPPDAENWVRIKVAAPLGFVGDVWQGGNKALGGPSPLTNMIVGGLLAGGLGYGAGAAAEQLFPERYLERGKLRNSLGKLGIGLGTLPGLHRWSINARNASEAGQPLGAWGSLVTPHANVPMNPKFSAAIKYAADALYGGQAGGLNVESVPVDAFNRAVWNDVRRGMAARDNPYGSKDPWGTDDQVLHTPPDVGAATTGLLYGIQETNHDAPVLTPMDVVRGIASAGVGLATAHAVGLPLAALAGLTPAAQEQLQSAGIFGGVLSAIIPALFRGR